MNALAIDCLTTRNLAPVSCLSSVAEGLLAFFAPSSVSLTWTGSDRHQHSANFETFNESILVEPWATGAVAIEDSVGKSWSVGFRRPTCSRAAPNQQHGESRQTEVTVTIAGDSAHAHKFVADPVPLLTQIYRTTRANYIIARESSANIAGLSFSATRGLVDMYWVNVFGAAYVKLMTPEKLRSLPAYKILDMPDGGMLVQLSRLPLEHNNEQWVQQRARSVEILGPDAFAPVAAEPAGGQFSAFGLIRLLRSIVAFKRSNGLGRNGRSLRVP